MKTLALALAALALAGCANLGTRDAVVCVIADAAYQAICGPRPAAPLAK